MDEIAPGTSNADEDLSLPKATMSKFVQDLLPPDISCTKETKDLFTECCVESNEICEKEQKKTIAGEHVISALKNLGFEEYIEDLQALIIEHQKTVKVDREKKSSKLDSGMTEEELIKSQEALFARARERMAMGSSTQSLD